MIDKVNKNKRPNTLKEAKCFYKEFDFTDGMQKGLLAEGSKKL
jgi:hypothetical protein